MPRVRVTALITVVLLATGCTEAPAPPVMTAANTPSAVNISPAPTATVSELPETATASPTAGADKEPSPVKCGLSRTQVGLFTRDWQRLVDAVGREDQERYTSRFVTRMKKVTKAAKTCPGSGELDQMNQLAERIDAAAKTGNADLDSINAFRKVGNDWLAELGYQPQLLS